MDSTVPLVGAAILVGWIMLSLMAKERQFQLREQEATQAREKAEAAAKPALPEPVKPAPVAKKAA